MTKPELIRFISRLLLFAGFAVPVYWVCIIIAGELLPQPYRQNLSYLRGAYGHTFTRMQEAAKTRDVDILFLGSSHTYRGFDPRLFTLSGIKTFNLGSSSQTPVHTRALLLRYLEWLNPEMVIWEVYPETFSLDGVEASLDLISNDRIDRHAAGFVFQNSNVKVLNTLLYSIFQNIVKPLPRRKEQAKKGVDSYIPGGYVEREKAYFRHETPGEPTEKEFKPKQIRAFQESLAMLKSRHIKVILVQAPVTRALYKSFSNAKEFDNLMQTSGEYYNFNNLLQLDDSLHFYDAHHLNQYGVSLFNRELIKRLQP